MINHLDFYTTLGTRSFWLILAEGTDYVELLCLGGIIMYHPRLFCDP